MPIRINLLAEQQAAEEARRRDPVKRAILAGGAIVALMVVWSVLLQMRIVAARAELTRYEAKLQSVEDNSKDARLRYASTSQIESRISNLQRYSTNRFFSATLLDALQQINVDDVHIVQLQSAHSYTTNRDYTFKTNFVFPIQIKKSWQFWKAGQVSTSVATLLSNQISIITNKIDALHTPVDLIMKIELATNRAQVVANVEITKPQTTSEFVTLTIKARDYSNPFGRRVDTFSRALSTNPYFTERLVRTEGEGIRLKERAIQPEVEQLDSGATGKPFIPFVIECRYRETVRANE